MIVNIRMNGELSGHDGVLLSYQRLYQKYQKHENESGFFCLDFMLFGALRKISILLCFLYLVNLQKKQILLTQLFFGLVL